MSRCIACGEFFPDQGQGRTCGEICAAIYREPDLSDERNPLHEIDEPEEIDEVPDGY